jgi:hypothetical protein
MSIECSPSAQVGQIVARHRFAVTR